MGYVGERSQNRAWMNPWFPELQQSELQTLLNIHSMHPHQWKRCASNHVASLLLGASCFALFLPAQRRLHSKMGSTPCVIRASLFFTSASGGSIALLSSYTIPMATVTAVPCHSQTITVLFVCSEPGISDQSAIQMPIWPIQNDIQLRQDKNKQLCDRGLAGKLDSAGI